MAFLMVLAVIKCVYVILFRDIEYERTNGARRTRWRGADVDLESSYDNVVYLIGTRTFLR